MTKEPEMLKFLPPDIADWLRSPFQDGSGHPTWFCISTNTINTLLLARILDRLSQTGNT